MKLINVGLASVDTMVGAFKSNMEKVYLLASEMSVNYCALAVFQEQVISGYPCEDLVHWPKFVSLQWKLLEEFACQTSHYSFPTMFVLGLTLQKGGNLFNCSALVGCGRIWGIVPKEKLPTYGVFYEGRVFSPGIAGKVGEINGIPFGDILFKLPFATIGLTVCEDIWAVDGPIKRRSYSGAEIIVNISASPWRTGIMNVRRRLLAGRSADNAVCIVYTNQYGGNDSLVFDGGGFIYQAGNSILEDTDRWVEDITIQTVDLEQIQRTRQENLTWRDGCSEYLKTHTSVQKIIVPYGYDPQIKLPTNSYTKIPRSNIMPSFEQNFWSEREEYFEDLIDAMLTGLQGYFEKVGVFKCIGISLSGGKDSALTLVLANLYACQRILAGKDSVDFVHCFSMPTEFNSDETKNLARELCDELGAYVCFKEISIQDAFQRELIAVEDMLGCPADAITKQNIQARIRAMRMWNWSNTAKALWLHTGNMSEIAVGYTTIGGDLMGGYSLIGNLSKTTVCELVAYLAEKYSLKSLQKISEQKASAELDYEQSDEDELMPATVLDICLQLFTEQKLMPEELVEIIKSRRDEDEEVITYWVNKFITLFNSSVFKWEQKPQAVHLHTLDLDRERALQIPVVKSDEWLWTE